MFFSNLHIAHYYHQLYFYVDRDYSYLLLPYDRQEIGGKEHLFMAIVDASLNAPRHHDTIIYRTGMRHIPFHQEVCKFISKQQGTIGSNQTMFVYAHHHNLYRLDRIAPSDKRLFHLRDPELAAIQKLFADISS